MTDYLRPSLSASHGAVLDPLSGFGLLLLPRPADDQPDPLGGPCSLHDADLGAGVRALVRLGWHVVENDESDEGWFLTEVGSQRVVEVAADDPIDGFALERWSLARSEMLASLL